MARPKKIFTEDEKKLLIALYEIGLSDENVAKVFKTKRTTFLEWIKQNDLIDTIKSVKGCADSKVEAALYQSALRGNTAAIVFWLCNRHPDKWKNANKVDIAGNITIPKVIISKPAEYKDKQISEDKENE